MVVESKNDLTGTLARLPDGQLVRIEIIHPDGKATVRRVEGDREGTIAVCAIKNLKSLMGISWES